MIYDTIQLIVNQINASIKGAGTVDAVTLGNIAQVDSAVSGESGNIIVTLVNIEEDASLKNGPHQRMKDGKIIYENRPINLYLYLLFSANLAVYSESLKRLGEVIEFFQGQNVFTSRNSPHLEKLTRTAEELAGFRVSMELFSLTFEQINHLWGSLGGKQFPFVLYRARLISLSAHEIRGTGSPILEVSLASKNSYSFAD
jgi:Pvc16 N-terminal domain